LLGERAELPGVAVVTQPGAARVARGVARALRSAGASAGVRVLPDGEAAKDLGVVADLYRWLADLGIGRRDLLVGVGGGAVTDVAGFAAATWLRGIEVVHVPTTLLGAVDAAVGGKTGVNLDGKNLVGAFHHPSRVVIDVDVLDALPGALRREGLAEALKTGLVGDARLVEVLEAEGPAADLAEVVRRSVAVKAAVVGRDFREAGEREILNYGHTIGHAVEVATGIRHGEAVAVGMVAAGRASAMVAGFAEETRQREVIARLGLPTAAAGAGRERILELAALDKKRGRSGLRMVLLAAVGDPRVLPVDSATVDAALQAIGV
jgi:3-dehydroquinate synthase